MIAQWMLYSLVVATLVGIAAWALEQAVRIAGRPGRWVWMGAFLLSLGIPIWAFLLPRIITAPPKQVSGFEIIDLGALNLAATAPSAFPLNTVLAVFWAVLSAVVVTTLVMTHRQMRRELARWPETEVDGVAVRITDGFGPAVIGAVKTDIVVPRWIHEIEDRWRKMVVAHENEHIKAGDTRLLWAGLAAAALAPWNISLWWQLTRLRDAVELDCDGRLVKAGFDIRTYGELLLEITRRGTATRLPAAALQNPKTLLARRIHMITQRPIKFRSAKAGLAAVLAAGFTFMACDANAPVSVDIDHENGTMGMVSGVYAESEVDKRPERLSGPPLLYPEMLRQAGIEGTVALSFIINEQGRVDSSSIEIVSSANRAFEGPSRDVIAQSIFTPAELNGQPVATRVSQTISFALQGSAGAMRIGDPETDQSLIRVRGAAGTDGTPTRVFVDGVEATGAELSEIRRDQIDRVEILKGAAAVAVYGESARGGVIQITKKKNN